MATSRRAGSAPSRSRQASRAPSSRARAGAAQRARPAPARRSGRRGCEASANGLARPGLSLEAEAELGADAPHGRVAGQDLRDDPLDPPVAPHVEQTPQHREAEALTLQ